MNQKNNFFLNLLPVITALLIVLVYSCNKEGGFENSPEPGNIADIDGNVYQTVIIGGREWMAENFRATRYNDGSRIDYPGADNSAWKSNTNGAYSWYNNNETLKDKGYGALYNWHAVSSGKLCPAGWRVPTDEEWTDANRVLAANAGGKLKDNSPGNWPGTNTGATNETGFNALPAGARFSKLPGGSGASGNGYFYYAGDTGRWWSSTVHSAGDAWYRSVYHNSSNIFRGHGDKGTGLSVRCIKD